MGSTMIWDVNGNLTNITKGSTKISYTYLADGNRSSKTINGTKTTYNYNNGFLLSETTGNETLYYYYDSAGRVASIGYQKGSAAEVDYFFTRNLHGDIIGVYRSSDSKLIGTYEYDLWGKLISAKEASKGIDTNGILTKNPFRYRGYYYDNETGFYNLSTRFYDPAIRRFIHADSVNLLRVATMSVGCKNLFNYCENNPVGCADSSGTYVDFILDVVTLGISINDVQQHPDDTWAKVGLVLDGADLILPGVCFLGEGCRGLRLGVKYWDDICDGFKDLFKLGKKVDTGVVDDAGEAVIKGGSDAIKSADLVFGSSTKSAQKLLNQMNKRGWTEDLIKNTVDNPHTIRTSVNKATGNSATVFYTQQGSYVIVDDITKKIVQISDNINPSTWAPDSSIIDPYIPD